MSVVLARIRWCETHKASVAQGWHFCEASWRIDGECVVVDAEVRRTDSTEPDLTGICPQWAAGEPCEEYEACKIPDTAVPDPHEAFHPENHECEWCDQRKVSYF